MESNCQNRFPEAWSTRSLAMRRPSAWRPSALCEASSLREAPSRLTALVAAAPSMSLCRRTLCPDLSEVATVARASRAARRLGSDFPDHDRATPSAS